MNRDLLKRLERLEHKLTTESFTVVYKDGHRELLPPSECIILITNEETTVKEFIGKRTKESGKMLDLLNGLLEKEM